MRIALFLSNLGGSPLFTGIQRALPQLGHYVECYRKGVGYDLILIFNQCAHDNRYIYPEFPTCQTPIAFIDTAEYGFFKRLPGVVNDFKNTFSKGAMDHDTKSRLQQERLRRFLEGKSFPYFLREHFKSIEFPACYHPIDYPLYALSECRDVPVKDEYVSRTRDLFVSWGASHPWRNNITAAMRACPVRSEISVIGENGHQRMPQQEYFRRTRAAKCSVSFDGYGSGSFRITEVLVRSLLLQSPLSIRTREPLIDGVHCVEYSVESDGETFLGTNICDKMLAAIADPERSFQIYQQGYSHCTEKLTERATAEYVLKTVESHDWSKATPLDL